MIPSRVLVAVVVSACALTLAGCGKKPVDPPIVESTAYVALGDSFTAVAGTGPYSDKVCRRSEDDYPALVAKAVNLASFEDVSCGGAAPGDLTGTQRIGTEGTNQAQLDAVSEDTKLVTMGIGLNERLNGQPIAAVLLQICLPENEDSEACKAYLQVSDSKWAEVIDQVGEQITSSLARIREQAPEARIVLVGYPRLLPDSGGCAKQLPLPTVALNRIRTTLRLTNETLKAVAKEAKADYVDIYTPSKGHDLCSADPWVNGKKTIKGKAEAFHPYKAYHRAVAAKIVALLKTKEPQAGS